MAPRAAVGRLLRKFSSRSEDRSPPSTPASSDLPPPIPRSTVPAANSPRSGVRKSRSLPKLRKRFAAASADLPEVVQEQRESLGLEREVESASVEETVATSRTASRSETLGGSRSREQIVLGSEEEKTPQVNTTELKLEDAVAVLRQHPVVVVEEPTPDVAEVVSEAQWSTGASQEPTPEEAAEDRYPRKSPEIGPTTQEPSTTTSESHEAESVSPTTTRKPRQHIDGPVRRPSLVDSANAKIVKTLLDSPFKHKALPSGDSALLSTASAKELFSPGIQDIRAMVQRKIWVKRPGASATLVQIREDDLVDDVREMILRKYANSLGKTFDAPDMTLSITTRAEHGDSKNERVLGPEEEMCNTIDSYYPGGQTVDEALTINVPQRRTPRPSPKVFQHPSYAALEDYRPLENGTDYFPPMPAVIPQTIPQTTSSHDGRVNHHHHPSIAAGAEHPRSISVLNTGTIPPVPMPSPGGTTRRLHHRERPKYHRQPTSSPTVLSHGGNAGAVAVNPSSAALPSTHMVHRASTRPRLDSSASDAHVVNGIGPPAPPLATPPAREGPPASKTTSNPPTPSGTNDPTAHRPSQRPRRSRKPTPEDRPSSQARSKNGAGSVSANSAVANAAVPPINVLIVEDNIINLRILEGLMKRLKVRWQTAMNGQIAVDKWKAGGFHLVLMDIQMPVMNGLQAAREIRRLERVNGIGVFGELESPLNQTNGTPVPSNGDAIILHRSKTKEDDKLLIGEGLFKSPVIIVALTASSLQSDRHEALAAGCNDFLNKPVNLVWLERKVKEWGCMQALIDYDGWRKWKDYAAEQEANKSEEVKAKEREKDEKARVKAEKMKLLQEKQAKYKEEKKKRMSLNEGGLADVMEGSSNGPVAGGGEAGNEATVALRTGAETLKHANFELG